eukprot:gene10587-11734_t
MYRTTLDSGKVSQYQRAVTPTIDPPPSSLNTGGMPGGMGGGGIGAAVGGGSYSNGLNNLTSPSSNNSIRGKILSYNPPPTNNSSSSSAATANNNTRSTFLRNNLPPSSNSSLGGGSNSSPLYTHNSQYRLTNITPSDINVQGMKSSHPYPPLRNTTTKTSDIQQPQDASSVSALLPRYDLIPVSDEIPPDGIIFAKIRNPSSSISGDTFVVFRTAEERLRNPERLNLDRRQLDHCPVLEQEQRLRLLNYQNNNIKLIANLENLPNLIFLDLYNNKIVTLDGPLSHVKGLRVLMAGKNRINKISNLLSLKKLDVLDLHSNEIKVVEGLEGLTDLRVLNLAGNRISEVNNLDTLVSLTELNLRRNQITQITSLNHLPALQRIFLSHNQIAQYQDIDCVFSLSSLIELSLDNNPLAEKDAVLYRLTVLSKLSALKHLDLKRVTDEERAQVQQSLLLRSNSDGESVDPALKTSNEKNGKEEPVAVADVKPVASAAVTATNASELCEHDTSKASSLTLASSKPNALEDGGDSVVSTPVDSGFEAKTGAGLSAAARAGRIAKNQNIFDVEILGADEKVLIASGEKWDLTLPRRILAGVTEICLLHIRKDLIIQKLNASSLQSFPALRVLRLWDNDLQSLKHLEFLPTLFGQTIEHLSIRENPINNFSEDLLRYYLVAYMPRLLTFNDASITSEDRIRAQRQWKCVDEVRNKAAKLFTNRNPTMGAWGASTDLNGRNDDSSDQAGSGRQGESNETGNGTRNKTSSLASLLRSTYASKEFGSLGNSLSGFSSAAAAIPTPGPWHVKRQNKMSYSEFSTEFDRIVLDTIKQTLQEMK